jgi:hypothetical protein
MRSLHHRVGRELRQNSGAYRTIHSNLHAHILYSEILRRSSSIASIKAHITRRDTNTSLADTRTVPDANPATSPAINPLGDAIPIPMDLDELEIPPTEPNMWEHVFQNRQNIPQDPTPSRSYSGGTSRTRTAEFDDPDRMADDNSSLETISVVYFGLDPSTQGLDAQTLLRAEQVVAHAVNGEFVALH